MHLQGQGIDRNKIGVGRVRQARGLRHNDRGVGIGLGIYDAYEGSETTTEAARDQQWSQGILDDNRGVSGGR